MIIIHVARIKLTYESGMGRISSMWRDAFEKEGHTFIHIGGEEVNKNVHVNLWGFYARKHLDAMDLQPDIVLVHEPLSGFFISNKFRTVIYSHGVEERAWQEQEKHGFHQLGWKSKLFPTFLRFYANNKGFRQAHLLMLSNTDDKKYLAAKGINERKIKIFKNGYYPFDVIRKQANSQVVFLFNATWIPRKGTSLLITAFNEILSKYPHTQLIIAGTGKDNVTDEFNERVRSQIQSVPRFSATEEKALYAQADVFVMPSYFEGQSLALTQAMAMGLCPVAADNCGQKDFIQHQQNGLLFETGNAADFTTKLHELLQSGNIATMGAAARNTVFTYTWPAVTAEIVQWCKETTKPLHAV